MKIIHITDTHLSPNKPHFNGNWAPLVRWIEETGADLVVHTGDLSVDGADKDEDLVFSMDLMRQVSIPMLIVPGNHDVGHLPGSAQPANPERLARWRNLVGPDYWVKDIGEWRIIGLNSLLMGFEDAEEQAQFDWLQKTLAERGDRRVAIFAHKPLFVDDANEGDTGYWSVRPTQRRKLYDLIAAHDVALFGSGHLHWTWKGEFGQTSVVWAPPTAFILDTMEREMPGERLVGAAVHELGDDVTTELVAVPGMTAYFLDDVVEEVYPQAAPKKQRERAE
ncbi:MULTISPECIES: metallophosphoesterase family protein [unclassified Rhizobium]|uniref:metallophosphoesterase family protein n=1 Tax=unclassified Rhizobium TaxID=2613769 RepID=UPI001ADCD5B6|nr:metallophosphoesterase [Rhizobium sp. 16-488-2b]MBO9177277.1 metallophosphoesterase [Rhizobium sp. 16-488-2a]